jgi:3-oxoacyl-[acyl-carrier-protein] synthase-3
MQGRFTIEGFGRHVPERVLTNADLEIMVDTTDEWIVTRTGIKERHIAAPGETSSDLAVQAAGRALAAAGREARELSHIFFATFTPDAICPPVSCVLQEKLGLKGLACLDLGAACSGFLYGIDAGMGALALRPGSTVLVTASEITTSRTNWADRATCVLFGDGAGAVILSDREAKPGQAAIEDILLRSDGSLWPLLTVKGGGSGWPVKLGDVVREDFFIEMNGPEVYKNAVRSMGSVCEEIMEKNGLSGDDIDLFIPHQANLRIIEAVGKRLKFFGDRVMVTVDRYGNTSAASVAIALADAVAEGRIKPGARVLLATFGGGFTWGAALLKFV